MSRSAPNPWPALLGSLGASLALALIYGALYLREAHQVERSVRERDYTRMAFFTRFFERDVATVARDVEELVNANGGLQRYLVSHRADDLQWAKQRAQAISRLHNEYDLIRYIDESGQELLRINHGGVPARPDELRNEKPTAYFQQTEKLAPGQIALSAFELTYGAGGPERPLKPILRFSTRVFDETGRPRGMYIINCLGTELLNGFSELLPSQQQRLRVLNAQGYWIKAARADDEWGFMLPDRSGQSLARTEPQLWSRILREPEGQVRRAGGLFTWNRISPAQIVTERVAPAIAADPFLVIATELSAAEWNEAFASVHAGFLMAGVSLLTLGAVVAFFVRLRRLQQRVLHQTEERAALVIESVTDYAILMLDASGLVVSWNTGAARIIGYRAEEITGQPVARFYPPEAVRSRLPERHLEAAAAEGRSEDGGWRLRKNGTRFWANTLITAIRDESRALVGFSVVTQDLTHRKEAELKIQDLNHDLKRRADQLETANRELEAFSYSVSHDLRAPLRHIVGYSELLEKEEAQTLSSDGQRFIQSIIGAAQRMSRLIDDLLSFSRVGRSQLDLEDIDHDALIAEVIVEGRYKGREPAVGWSVAPLGAIRADRVLLRLAWANLIDNAVKYSGKSAQPRVEIGKRLDPDSGEVIFFIRDNGVGFDMRFSAKLFGVFQRLHDDSQFEGTGIGLANVQRIVGHHGGRIWAESKVGEGATFFFSLPDSAEAGPNGS